MYAKSLSIKNFKCFGQAELELQFPGRGGAGVSKIDNVNLILGDNGGGKSSVLRALAIAVLAPILPESGFVPHRLVRRPLKRVPSLTGKIHIVGVPGEGEAMSTSELDLQAELSIRTTRSSLDKLLAVQGTHVLPALEYEDSPAFFIVGYGATRRVESGDHSPSSARRSRGLRYQRISSLFEDHVALQPLQSWLPRLKRRARLFAEAVELIDDVLPDNIGFNGRLSVEDDDEQYVFEHNGIPTPLSSLSDGYKAFIGWVSDLVGNLASVAPSGKGLREIAGIVLVDEIDLHLHPAWQRSVIPMLSKAFPKLQFVFTSHSPIVASTVMRENVFVTDTAEDGTATIKQLQEHVFGRSPEDLLLSGYFGLLSTRPEDFAASARELFKRAASGDADAALEFLDQVTSPAAAEKAARERGGGG